MVDKKGYWLISVGLTGLLILIFGIKVFDTKDANVMEIFSTIFCFVMIFIGLAVLFLRFEYKKRKRVATIYFLIAALILLVAWVLKTRHLPGAGLHLIIGIFFFVFT
jgi:uncharacterized membrane protein SirB2